MRKIISIFTVLLLAAGCFSCSEKKDTKSDNKPVESDTSVTGTDGSVDEPVIQQQTELREFKEDDFKTINVNITKTENEPPVQLHSMVTSDIDFGERISPCKGEKYRDKYKPVFDDENNADDENREYMEQADAEWEKSCTEPAKGSVGFWCQFGNDMYTAVSYDQYCTDGLHEVSIFRINGLTGEKTEIYRHSDPVRSFDVNDLYVYHDRIYIYLEDQLAYIDEDKGELVKIDHLNDYSGYFVENDADRLLVVSFKARTQEVPDDYEPKTGEEILAEANGKKSVYLGEDRILSEYFPDEDRWSELSRVSITKDEANEIDDISTTLPQIYGKLFAWPEKPEGKRKYDVVTDEYRISTGLTGLDILYADHDRLAVRLSSKNIVHIFDIAKMEHYVIDCTSLGVNSEYFGGGLFAFPSGMSGTLYYIMPELGLTFPLVRLESGSEGNRSEYFFGQIEGGNIAFEQGVSIGKKEVKDGQIIYYTDYDTKTTRYWVNGDEMNG